MSQGSVPPDVGRFIADHIQTADQLEILLLLHGGQDREWTAREVSEAVFTVPASATMRLESLVASGFLASSGGPDPSYAFQPASAAQRAQVDALAGAYAADRVAVITRVFQRRSDPLQSFSDAFRVRPD